MQTRRTFPCGLAVVAVCALLGPAVAYPLADDPPVAGQRGVTGPEADYFSALGMIGRVTGSHAVLNLVTSANLSATVQARVRWAKQPAALPTSPNVSPVALADRPWATLGLKITGLQPNRKYFYQVQYETSDDPGVWVNVPCIGEFYSQKTSGESFSFCLVADAHWGHAWQVQPGSPQRWTGEQCLRRILEDRDFDFCVDLGDSPYPLTIRSAVEALNRYADWRAIMAGITARMPVFLVLGNHEQEAGFFQRGTDHPPQYLWNHLSATQYQQKWATEARLRFVPNPRGDTYPQGGEGPPQYDSADDWHAGTDPWNDGTRSHIQNFYAWTWGDALFVVLDPFRYTRVGSCTVPNSPSQWTLGPTQMRWLHDVLAASDARWKFILAHHLVGGGLINIYGQSIQDGGNDWAYGRGSGIEADRPGTEQAIIHRLALQHGVQFFVYAHDHAFCHSVNDGVHYICCGRPTFLNEWWRGEGMRESYGNLLVQGQDKPWTRMLYSVLGYAKFYVTPDLVTMEWIRTGYSFPPAIVPIQQARRDWRESWAGKPYPVVSPISIEVSMVPTDVDGIRTVQGATVTRFFRRPPGRDYYIQPDRVRPEDFANRKVPMDDFQRVVAAVDTIPEHLYQYTWWYDGDDAGDSGHRDLADYAALQVCYSPESGSVPSTKACACMDLDDDQDVDPRDVAAFMSGFSGPR